MSEITASNLFQFDASQCEIHSIHVRDLSVEVPNSPNVFQLQWNPKIDLHFQNYSKIIEDNVFYVTLVVQVHAYLQEEIAFVVDLHQSGVFSAPSNINQELFINAYCPHILFPYAREVIGDITRRAGFPPLNLNPVDFFSLYENNKMPKDQVN